MSEYASFSEQNPQPNWLDETSAWIIKTRVYTWAANANIPPRNIRPNDARLRMCGNCARRGLRFHEKERESARNAKCARGRRVIPWSFDTTTPAPPPRQRGRISLTITTAIRFSLLACCLFFFPFFSSFGMGFRYRFWLIYSGRTRL